MPLSIVSIKLSDSIDQIAQTCHLDLVSSDVETTAIAEFSFPGDSSHTTVSDLRPDGTRINVNLGYGSIAPYTAFSGIVDHLDDTTDPDAYSYGIDLADLPDGLPERTTFTKVYNMLSIDNYLNDFQRTTSHIILADACALVGITFGRCDLPDYNIWGTFEVIRKNVIQLAEELCGPFNTFPHTQYKTRCDRNGLQIIKIDYTLGGEVPIAHTVVGDLHVARTFSRYMPENRLGSLDVVLDGGEIYGTNVDVTQNTFQFTATKTYTNDSRNIAANGQTRQLEKWVETTTNMQFTVTARLPPGDLSSIGTPLPPDNKPIGSGDNTQNGVVETDYVAALDDLITQLQAGTLATLNIVDSYTISEIKTTYTVDASGVSADSGSNLPPAGTLQTSDGPGSIDSVTTVNNTYQKMQFIDTSFTNNLVTRKVLTYSETITIEYPAAYQLPVSMSRVYHSYNTLGVEIGTLTVEYIWDRDSWLLINITSDTPSQEGTTNAEMQLYVNNPIQASVPAASVTLGGNTNTTAISAVQIGQYKMLNCLPLPTGVPRIDANSPFLGGADVLKSVYGIDNQLIIANFAARVASHISCPHMDFSGMKLICPLVEKQRYLEQQNAYWETIKVVAALDAIPFVGESAIIASSSGIVQECESEIDEDSALTTISMQRLVVPS